MEEAHKKTHIFPTEIWNENLQGMKLEC